MSSDSTRNLTRTKLYVPVPRADIVARPRLTSLLEEALARPLTLVCASAGYGKTTLLSQWLSQHPIPAAWLSLDKQDNDPIRFWSYIIAALQTIRPDLGQTALAELHAPQPLPLMSVLSNVLDQISRRRKPLVLVLDDYQFINEHAVHESLTFFLDHLPRPMHLVIATRADPPLPLGRFRARNQMIELRARDLRFTPHEAAAFLDRMTGSRLSAEDVAALDARTEGWIAGLQLAAISMRGHSDPTGFVKSFTGSQLYVAEYLVEEVLQQQPEDVQMFLLQTAILDRLNAALCEAVTGRQDGQAMLMALHRSNLFLIPLDEQGRWFRYHHLFADLLIHRLMQTLPASAMQELHRRASAWLAQNDMREEAIQHALEGKDYDNAVSLVEPIARTMMFAGKVNLLRTWLDALPEDSFHHHPRLDIYRVWIDLMQGKADLSEQALNEREDRLDALPSSLENDKLRVELMVVLCRFVALSGNTARAIRYAQEALEYLPEGDLASRARVNSALAIAYGMEGQVELAERSYHECLDQSRATGNYSLAAHTTMLIAHGKYQHYGRLREAAELFQSIIDTGVLAGQGVFYPAGQGYIGLAGIHLEWNNMETAEDYLKRGMELCSQGGLDGVFTGYLIRSRLRQAKGDLEGGLEELRLLQQASPKGDPFAIADRQINIGLAMGDRDSASRWAMPLLGMLRGNQSATKLPLLIQEAIETLLIRVLVAQGEVEKATQLLDTLQASAEPGGRFGRMIEVHLLRARALMAKNPGTITPIVLEKIEQALDLAEPEGYVLRFLEEGKLVIPLLNAVLNHTAAPDRLRNYARKLLDALPGVAKLAAVHLPDSVTELVEPLTARELEVLQLIAGGDSNQGIAVKLVITVSAVKKHASNVFGKLGVSSRTQAVIRARQLGLLVTDR